LSGASADGLARQHQPLPLDAPLLQSTLVAQKSLAASIASAKSSVAPSTDRHRDQHARTETYDLEVGTVESDGHRVFLAATVSRRLSRWAILLGGDDFDSRSQLMRQRLLAADKSS